MRLEDAFLCWTPARMPGIGGPAVLVVPFARRSEPAAKDHRMWIHLGDKDELRGTAVERGATALMLLFIHFHTLVVRDGIPIADAHREFLKIKEYRATISRDISGADDGDDE